MLKAFAQEKTTDTTVKSTTAKTTTPAAKKPKEIKKLDDPLLLLPAELIYKINKMNPNQLLVLDERFVRNEKRTEDGEEFEVTVTVRLGFSQDMITGIVKEVPLYNSAERETNIIYVKIPVKFCCTTPIDTLHTKQHCGKMSELNDFEDNEHCKEWLQKNEAQESAESVAGFGKPTTNSKKKGGVSGKTSPVKDDEAGGFGKPTAKDNKKKKGKDIAPATDTVNYRPEKQEVEKKDSKKDKKTKETPAPTKKKEDKTEADKEEGYGKPAPKNNKKKKGKETQPATDSVNYRPEKQEEKNNTDTTNTKKDLP